MRSSLKLATLGALTLGALVLALGLGAGPASTPTFAGGDEERGWLGVSLQDMNPDLREALGIRGRVRGALVTRVIEDSPADKAGLRGMDVITELDGERVESSDDLIDIMRGLHADQRVSVSVSRDNRTRTLEVKLGSRSGDREDIEFRGYDRRVREHLLNDDDDDSDEDSSDWDEDSDDWDKDWDEDSDQDSDEDSDDDRAGGTRWFTFNNDDDDDDDGDDRRVIIRNRDGRTRSPRGETYSMGGGAYLGVRTMELEEQLAEFFQVPGDHGVLVIEVLEDTPAEEAGLKAGDVILDVDGDEVEEPDDLRRLIRRHDPEEDIEIRISREGSEQTMKATLASRGDLGMMPQGLERLHLGDLDLHLPDLGELPDLSELGNLHLNLPELEFHGELSGKEWREIQKKLRKNLEILRHDLHDLKRDLHDKHGKRYPDRDDRRSGSF